jgi:hypothetical protein
MSGMGNESTRRPAGTTFSCRGMNGLAYAEAADDVGHSESQSLDAAITGTQGTDFRSLAESWTEDQPALHQIMAGRKRERNRARRVSFVVACAVAGVAIAACGGSASGSGGAGVLTTTAVTSPTTVGTSTTITTTPSAPSGVGNAFASVQLKTIAAAVNNLASACPAPDPNDTDTYPNGGCGEAASAVTSAVDAAADCTTSPTLGSDLSNLKGAVFGITSYPIPPAVDTLVNQLNSDDTLALQQGGQPLSLANC